MKQLKNKSITHFSLIAIIISILLFSPDFASAEGEGIIDTVWNWTRGFASPIDFALYSILVLMGWLVNFGAILLSNLTDASIFQELFKGSGEDTIKSGWFFVRDFFNIFFILILLFSAFATIFQVEKFHLKRTLLMIVLMALLVNFSWPITMIIIDFGNVIMYFFLNNLFTNTSGTGLAASVSAESGIARLIVPLTFEEANDMKNAATELMFRIIFMFLYAITIVTIGAIFLLRLVMLVILAIFAPIGFVAAIMPSTQKYASMWWENLFKWVFIGPIMVFMLALSLNLMTAFSKGDRSDDSSWLTMEAYSLKTGDILATGVQVTAAIVILWAGIIVAGKMGGAGGSMLTGYANKAAKWGGRMAVKGSWGLTKAGGRGAARLTRTQGMVGAIKQKWDQSVVAPGQTAKSSNTAKWSARMGVKGAQAKDIQNRASQYDKDNLGNDDLQSRADKGDAAAVLALAKRGQLEEIPATVIAQMNADPGVEGLLSGEIKKKRVDLIIATKHEQAIQKEMTKNGGNRVAAKSSIDLADIERKEFGKLDAEKFASQDWHSIRGDITKPPSDSARRLVQVAKKASPQAQTEMVKRMSAGDFATFNEISSHP